jgi:hypothetical protein
MGILVVCTTRVPDTAGYSSIWRHRCSSTVQVLLYSSTVPQFMKAERKKETAVAVSQRHSRSY